MKRVMRQKNCQRSSGLLVSIVHVSLIVVIAAMTTVKAHASSEPFSLGPDTNEDEKKGDIRSSRNNYNEDKKNKAVPGPFFGFRSPSSYMFSSPFFDEIDDPHGDFRPSVPLRHFHSSQSLSSFMDEAAIAHQKVFSSFFGDEHYHDSPLQLQHQLDDGTEKAFLRLKSSVESLSDPTITPHPFLRRRGMWSLIPTMPQLIDDRDVTDDNKKFQVSFQLPDGIELRDVQVRVQDGGRRLVIQGRSSSVSDNLSESKTPSARLPSGDNRYNRSSTAIQFSRSYSLDPNVVRVNDFVATVNNGRLTVSAPKIEERLVQKQDHVVKIQDLNEKQSKFAKFIPSRVPQLLRTLPSTSEKGEDKERGKENDVIAAAQTRADQWKEFSQMTS
jgi:HSP20 family molecular chaperone IbpA